MKFVNDAVEVGLDSELVALVKEAEKRAGFSFVITSAFREGDSRCHGVGKAVDIRSWNASSRMKIVEALIFVGFQRIGVYNRHVHADICDDTMPVGVLWMGVSR